MEITPTFTFAIDGSCSTSKEVRFWNMSCIFHCVFSSPCRIGVWRRVCGVGDHLGRSPHQFPSLCALPCTGLGAILQRHHHGQQHGFHRYHQILQWYAHWLTKNWKIFSVKLINILIDSLVWKLLCVQKSIHNRLRGVLNIVWAPSLALPASIFLWDLDTDSLKHQIFQLQKNWKTLEMVMAADILWSTVYWWLSILTSGFLFPHRNGRATQREASPPVGAWTGLQTAGSHWQQVKFSFHYFPPPPPHIIIISMHWCIKKKRDYKSYACVLLHASLFILEFCFLVTTDVLLLF